MVLFFFRIFLYLRIFLFFLHYLQKKLEMTCPCMLYIRQRHELERSAFLPSKCNGLESIRLRNETKLLIKKRKKQLWTTNCELRVVYVATNNWPSSLNYMEISLKLIFNFLVATFNKEQSNSLLHRNIALLYRPSSSWLIEEYKNNENKHKRKNDLEPDWSIGNYERERSLQQITSHDFNEEQRQ